jgi:hypothetical protein
MNKKAFNYLAALGLLVLSQGAMASCDGVMQNHMHIQWSDPARVVSPDRAWQVEVHPDLTSDENESEVSLRRCSDGSSSKLFTLERSADIYWEPDGGHLLVLNQPDADVSKLLLVDEKSRFVAGQSPLPLDFDNELRGEIRQRLGATRNIAFYLLNFVSWNDKTLVLSVGGATYSGASGPMTPYCYGAVIDSYSARIKSILSAQDLQSKFNTKCEIFP